MNRTIKEAIVKRFFYDTHEQFKAALVRLHRRLQLRQTTQDTARPHILRNHLQTLDARGGQIYSEPNPPNAETKQVFSRLLSQLTTTRVTVLRLYPKIQPGRTNCRFGILF